MQARRAGYNGWLVTLLAGFIGAGLANATDPYEPDAAPATFITSGHPPQLRDLAATGGVADRDWFHVVTRSYRSYEARIDNVRSTQVIVDFERWDGAGNVKLQDGAAALTESSSTPGGPRYLRWKTGVAEGFAAIDMIHVRGRTDATSINSDYAFQFRETTLFCPRFNNSAGQVSVLLVQAALDGTNTCDISAHFFDQVSGTLLATQTDAFSFGSGAVKAGMRAYSMPGIVGLAGQRGMAQIAHTCGYGNLKAKLVALEPATGFSFDTPCTMREQ